MRFMILEQNVTMICNWVCSTYEVPTWPTNIDIHYNEVLCTFEDFNAKIGHDKNNIPNIDSFGLDKRN